MAQKIDDVLFAELWRAGVKGLVIRRVFGISRTSLSKRVIRLQLPRRTRPIKITRGLFVLLWSRGVRICELMRHFRVTRTAIQKARRRFGLPPRPNLGRPKGMMS